MKQLFTISFTSNIQTKMDIPKIHIEQVGKNIVSGHHIVLKGDKKSVVIMMAYVAKENPEVAEALLNSAAIYLREHPGKRRAFAELAGIN